MQRYGRVAPGQAVVVHAAAGGLGSLCVQLRRGRRRPVAMASTPEKLEFARGHGAAAGALTGSDDLAEPCASSPAGAAPTWSSTASADRFPAADARARLQRRLCVVGSASQQPDELDVRSLMPRTQTVVGFVVARVAEQDPAEPQRAFDAVQERFRDGRLRPEVSLVGMDDIAGARERIESRSLTGKLVVDVTGADWR